MSLGLCTCLHVLKSNASVEAIVEAHPRCIAQHVGIWIKGLHHAT